MSVLPLRAVGLGASEAIDPAVESRVAAQDRLLIDGRELAHFLSLSLRTIRRMDAARELPGRVVLRGRVVRWRLDLIRAWIANGCTTEPQRPAQANGRPH
jgi:predicted DNA-binding transcriptional regulator AlpA